MKEYIVACGLIFSFLFMTSSYALTINGAPINSPVSVCFDDAEISNYISDPAELAKKKQWVRDAIEKESWGYYTNLSFTGWGNCSNVSTYDFRITANGAVSYGNTIEVPFKNIDNPHYERYHIQSATVHEAGHFLRFPHEHLRVDSTHYQQGDHGNQKFRFRMVDSTWFTIRPDTNLNLCLTISSGLDVTQELCNNSHSQHFKFKDGGHGTWSRIENRSNLQCFDIRGGGNDVGAQLISYSCHGGDNQQFKTLAFLYQNSSETIYAVQIKQSLQWLDIPNGATNSGVNPIQYPGYFSDYTHLTSAYDPYSVMSYENGSLRPNSFILSDGDISGSRIVYGNSGTSRIEEYIVTNNANKCMTHNVTSGLTQSSCSTSDPENKFRIIYLDEHYFRIFNPDANKCLAVNGSDLVMENCSPEGGNSNDQQRFTFIDESVNGAEWTRIQSKSSNQCLDLYGGLADDGAEIGLWSCHTGYNQYFRVTRDITEAIFD